MSEELWQSVDRERAHLNELGQQFARTYPKIAGRLRLGDEQTQDPHVERLLQGFAFLTGRVRQKLNDEFPELTESLLGVLYPHYQAPVPSMGVIQYHLAAEQTESPLGYPVKKEAVVQTPPIDGTPCTFRSTYPVHLWPIQVESAKLNREPFKAPETKQWRKAGFVLELVLKHVNPEASLAGLKLSSLRFFLKGLPQHMMLLYELLLNNTLEVAIASKPGSLTHSLLPASSLRPVGFERDQGMLPYPARSHLGYRLLTEFFTFPTKFLFVDLAGLEGQIPKDAGSRVHVYFYLARNERLKKATFDLEQYVKPDTFRLGCTPVVNLYEKLIGPVKMDPTQFEYRLVPDPRNLKAHEIYTVNDQITATNTEAKEQSFYPLFSTAHGRTDGAYWVLSRRPAVPDEGEVDKGTDVYLSLVDLEQKREGALGWTLDVRATCLNRDLPERLPFGGDKLRLTVQDAGGISQVEALTPFTPTHRPAMRRGALWRLISHLSLNHLSLTDQSDTAEALREVLLLYEFTGEAQTRRFIEGLRSVKAERIVARPGGAVCRGLQITVIFDEDYYSGNELYLFASILERFFALYGSMNSFTKMVAKIKNGRETLHEWAPRAGERVLI